MALIAVSCRWRGLLSARGRAQPSHPDGKGGFVLRLQWEDVEMQSELQQRREAATRRRGCQVCLWFLQIGWCSVRSPQQL